MGRVADHLNRNQRIFNPDARLLEACEGLRYAVEHPNERSEIILQQGIYREKDPQAIMTIKVDGLVIGYMVKPSSALELSPYFDRYVYFKTPGHRLTDLSKQEMSAIKTAILEAFFEVQQGQINVEVVGFDAMLLWQRFMVVFPVERNPNVIALAGGFGAGPRGLSHGN